MISSKTLTLTLKYNRYCYESWVLFSPDDLMQTGLRALQKTQCLSGFQFDILRILQYYSEKKPNRTVCCASDSNTITYRQYSKLDRIWAQHNVLTKQTQTATSCKVYNYGDEKWLALIVPWSIETYKSSDLHTAM